MNWIAVIIIYILSVIGVYWYMRLSLYHKNGIYTGGSPDIMAYFWMLFPIGNTIFNIVGWLFYFPIRKTPRKPIDYTENIFKPKKKDV